MRFIDYDWREIMFDLKRLGMTGQDIAREAGGAMTEQSVRLYMTGSSPLHWRGEVILQLWEKKMGKPRCEAPVAPAQIRNNVIGRRAEV